MNRVWKNTLVTALYVVLAAVAIAYFYFASQLRGKGKSGEVCKAIKVTLLDSSLNKFVTKEEIVQIIERFNGEVIGKKNRQYTSASDREYAQPSQCSEREPDTYYSRWSYGSIYPPEKTGNKN